MKRFAQLAVLCCFGAGCGSLAPPVANPAEKAAVEPSVNEAASVAKQLPPSTVPESTQKRIEAAIENVSRRDLSTQSAFWTVFHGILGLGPGLSLRANDGSRVNALDYVLGGDFRKGEITGLRFIPTNDGLDVQIGPQYDGQGHQDQFVAEIAQWGAAVNRPVIVHGKPYTIADFARETKAHSRIAANQELSWAIVVISQYDKDGTAAEWTNRFGERLKFEQLIRYELDQPIDTAACGGTHRLFGLTWALHHHLKRGGKATGVWNEVAAKNDQYRDLAKSQQYVDGCFSSNYFKSKTYNPDVKERLGSAGHILEYLAISLTDEELREPWMQNAADAVAMMFLQIQSEPMESGALYHAIHGLIIYHHRVFGKLSVAVKPAAAELLKRPTQAVESPVPKPLNKATGTSGGGR